MLALTIIQPWATLIVEGPKRIENRTWRPSSRLLKRGDVLAIHAGKKTDQAGGDMAIDMGLWDASNAMKTWPVRGAIIGLGTFVETITESDDPWFAGPIGWVLSDVCAIEPVFCKGAQGLWVVPDDIEAQVRKALAA